MSHQKVKKQHYVPQNYLRRFADVRQKLFVFDKVQDKSYPASVGDIAQDRYFYDIPIEALEPDTETPDYDPQMVEKEFSRIEGEFRIDVDELLSNTYRGITQQQRSAMAFFIMIQLLRTQEFRTEMMEMYTKMGEMMALLELENNPDLPPVTRATPTWTEGQKAALHAQTMFDPELQDQMALHLFSHIWILGLNNTAKPLYTSDHPVAKEAHIRSHIQSYDSVASQGIEIAFPLTPGHILILRERSYHRVAEPFDGKTLELTEDNVTYFNSLQVRHSHRQLYCSADDFILVRQMCKETPHVTKPNRDRIHVLNGGKRVL